MEASLFLSTTHLCPDWIDCILEDSEFEASLPQIKLLRNEGRSSVWEMCAWFGCRKHGVPGQACRLFERYLFSVLHHCVDFGDEFLQAMLAESPLLLASCISLSAKMSNSALMLRPKAVKIVLLCKNIRTTIDDIIATEFKVFKALDFRVPMWTTVEVGEMLAVKVGFPVKMLERVAMVVDVAEFHRNIIDSHVKRVAHGKEQLSSISVSGVLSLHLTAGAVAAAARLGQHAPDAARQLAQLTRAPPLYIECIQNVICAEILSAPQGRGLTLTKSGRVLK